MYDAEQSHTDYDACWKELINTKHYSLVSNDIYVGPQGAAAAVTLPSELQEWFQVQDSTPHVTLLTAEGHESHEMGPMVKAALQVREWLTTSNKYVHVSPDAQYMRISSKVYDVTVAEKVLVTANPPPGQMIASEYEDLLAQVPQELWSKHKTDVGYVKAAQPIHIKVKPGARLPYQRQYPLRQHAIEGIEPTIKGLEEAGVLVKTRSTCNTPIFPIRKPHSDDYRLVHDLRAINAIVDVPTPVVPDPHTLLSNIPPGTKWYTVIDLCSAFFSVPIHQDSQHLFAFTYNNSQYTYTRLPQGFVDSPSAFNRVLAQDLQNLQVQSTVLQYVDDLLICSPTEEQCAKDSVTVLTELAKGGHKVSKTKLQFCQPKVDYLGRQLWGDKRHIALSQIEAIVNAPKPQTVGDMLSFLGMAGFSRPWICDYALKTAPLRALIRAAGQQSQKSQLQWTEGAEGAFVALKQDMQSAPAIGNPDYSEPFHLYVAERAGYANAVLMQDSPTGKQPLAYYSTKLDNIEAGLPPCYQGLAAASFAFQKASSITMGHPVTLYTSHQLHALLTSQRFVLTHARRTGYEVILSAPELTIQRCSTINPATRMVLPTEGTPHDCVADTTRFMRARDDLHNLSIPADLTLFVDGSCFRDAQGNHAGYGVVQLEEDGVSFREIQTSKIAQPCSAQLAEIKALTAACKLAADKRLNVYTDSSYAYGVCHVYGNIWKQRGFRRADGTPIAHGDAISQLLEAMHLPTAIAIIKCPAHQKTNTMVAEGNNMADDAARRAATGGDATMGPILVADDLAPLITMPSLITAQDRASPQEKSMWLTRGAIRTSTPGPQHGLWRSCHGHFVMPSNLLQFAIRNAHGVDHCARGEVIRRLQKVWWSPYLAATVDKTLAECEICAKYNIRKSFTAPIAHIPVPDGPFRHLMIDYIDMTQRIGRLRYILVVICRFSRWVEAVPTSGPDANSVAKFLCKEVFPRFGIPDTISSDNGPHFVANTTRIAFKMLGIKQRFGCVYHPQSQGAVERANGSLKAKLAKIMQESRLNWVQALPIALMGMRTSTNRLTHLTPHEMLTGRPMPVPYLRGPVEGPPLERLERELQSYLQHLTKIHKAVFSQVKGATLEREVEIPETLQQITPGDWVFVKVFKRKWDEPRREGPFKVHLATRTALKVEGKKFWFHLNHCSKAEDPEGTFEAYRRRAPSPGTEGVGNATPQSQDPHQDGDGNTSPQEARRSQRLADARRRSEENRDIPTDSERTA